MRKSKITEDVPTWMRWVIMIFYIIGIALIFSSCSISKKINKNKLDTSQNNKIDSAANVKKDVTKESISTSVITEKATVMIDQKGFTHSGASHDIKSDPILISDNGFTATVTDSAGTTLLKVKLEDKKLPVIVDKKTVITSETKEADKTKSTIGVKKDEEKQSHEQITDKNIDKSFVLPWWLWLLLILLGLLLIYWKLIRR